MSIDISKIESALMRLEDSLNKRYEKNAELFISNQNIHEIKNDIYHEKYSNLDHLHITKNITPEIILMTVFKNIWLVKSKGKSEKLFIEWLSKFFKEKIKNPILYKTYFEDIFRNQYDISLDLKNEFYEIYYEDILTLQQIEQEYIKYKNNRTSLSVLDVIKLKFICKRLLKAKNSEQDYVNFLFEISIFFDTHVGDQFFDCAHLNIKNISKILINQYLNTSIEKINLITSFIKAHKDIMFEELFTHIKNQLIQRVDVFSAAKCMSITLRNNDDLIPKIIRLANLFKSDERQFHIFKNVFCRPLKNESAQIKTEVIKKLEEVMKPYPNKLREIIEEFEKNDIDFGEISTEDQIYDALRKKKTAVHLMYVARQFNKKDFNIELLSSTILNSLDNHSLYNRENQQLWEFFYETVIISTEPLHTLTEVLVNVLEKTNHQSLKISVLETLKQHTTTSKPFKNYLLTNAPTDYHRLYPR